MLQLNIIYKNLRSITCNTKLTLMAACVMGIILFTTAKGFAQNVEGIKFQKGLSWSKILEKAKKENKFIFLNGYTTWCVPCKEMAMDIFPRSDVGAFFNQNFISVAVQFDVTSSDDLEVRSWYDDAKKIHDKYQVQSYPTYLYFNPEGHLVHTLLGSTVNAKEFIEKSKLALDPKTQYSKLKQQYQNGNRDSIFLATLTAVGYSLGDQDSLKYYAQDYLRLKKDLFSANDVRLIVATTRKSSGIGFAYLRNHSKLVDSIVGPGVSKSVIKHIVSNEIVRPLTRLNLTITEYRGGMVVYGGTIIPNVDWQLAKNKLDADYSDISDEVLRKAKLEHFQELKDWKQYVLVIEAWRKSQSFDQIERDELDNYLRSLFDQCADKTALKYALKWSMQNLKADKSNLSYLLLNNKLLYKNGKHKTAVKNMRNFVKIDSPFKLDALSTLNKMEKREEI